MVKVIPRDGEDFESTLKRFERKVRCAYRRKWHKRRYGFYERPSILRRKRNMIRDMNRRHYGRGGKSGYSLRLGVKKLFARNAPSNAKGR